MADSTMVDLSKMKVVDLRKELKTRGLSTTGDKAELLARLQAAMSQSQASAASDSNDEHGDINLDSDIDSDGVLEDEDDKNQVDILEDSAVDTLNEELALAEQPAKSESKPPRILKRKITAPEPEISKTNPDDDNSDPKTDAKKEPPIKKIVLNRTMSTSSTSTKPSEDKVPSDDNKTTETTSAKSTKIRITVEDDSKSKLELRAKRFGLPVQMSEAERKEARKKRFGQGSVDTTTNSSASSVSPVSLSENLDKLKKRAERFGVSVSKMMTDIEQKEKMEKRKAKFAAA